MPRFKPKEEYKPKVTYKYRLLVYRDGDEDIEPQDFDTYDEAVTKFKSLVKIMYELNDIKRCFVWDDEAIFLRENHWAMMSVASVPYTADDEKEIDNGTV